jgi:hypothetical protein
MFCPGCGIEESQNNQFCRACGTDLRAVRTVLERPDNITASAISARDEIGRAVALKIRETHSAGELAKVTEVVLPGIEKFLESPEEKRMRRIRAGTIISSIGIGVMIALTLVAIASRKEEFLFLAGLGGIAFFLGLGFMVNAFFFTVPKKSLSDRSTDARSQRELDFDEPRDLDLPATNSVFTSVTEGTTRQLEEKQPVIKKSQSSS